MKKYFILLLTLICISSFALAEEIKLIPSESLEKDINLESVNKNNIMQSLPDKLENNGIFLQNSITPVKGLIYNSQSIKNQTPPNSQSDENQ